MASEHQKQLGLNNGLISILKEFTRSVDKLNQTVLFPVRLQDMDITSVMDNNSNMSETLNHCFSDKGKGKEINLYELFILLRNTKSELVTGNDVDGIASSTLLHKDLRRIMGIMKQLTELSESVRFSYESSLMPSRNG